MLKVLLPTIFFSMNASAFVPSNNLSIPENKLNPTGISKEQFESVIDKVNTLYAPIVEAQGARLIFNRKWEDNTVNASAARDMSRGTDWYVSMYGGLARHPQMTEDGFLMVVCHELGHHLGGYPKKSQPFQVDRKWSSVEGQSDYFATLKCARRVFEGEDNAAILASKKVSPAVVEGCAKSFSNHADQLICQRSALAGFEVSKFIEVLTETKKPIAFETPDKKKVMMIEKDHNGAQCRLDTFFQGALCDKSVDEDLSKTEGHSGACTKKNGDTHGLRPRCWMTAI